MALRDHFMEKWGAHGESPKDEEALPTSPEEGKLMTDEAKAKDEWALVYLNALKAQAISEAFDDDASGFITVAEVNSFTTSRPLDWR